MDIPRIEPTVAHQHASEGDALIVCAYDDEQKCDDLGVADAMPLTEFEDRAEDLDRRREIIFYCN